MSMKSTDIDKLTCKHPDGYGRARPNKLAPTTSHLAKVYPTSTSKQLPRVVDPFLTEFQKRSLQSFLTSVVHMFYIGFLCMEWLMILKPGYLGDPWVRGILVTVL